MRKWLLLLGCLCCTSPWVSAQSVHTRTARDNMPAVVAVNVAREDGSTFTGTGFILTPDGLIATSRHVVEQALYVNITFSNGAVSEEAKIVAHAPKVDLALLKINAQHLPTVQVVSSARVQPGQEITVIGNPRRLQNTVSSGLISQVRQKADGILWHQISAPISPSSSGSPVFNTEGKVIGVAFASYSGENNQNLNFAVPSDYLLQLIQSAGYSLPDQALKKPDLSTNPFIRHIQKSWELLLRILHHFFGPKDPLAA